MSECQNVEWAAETDCCGAAECEAGYQRCDIGWSRDFATEVSR